MENFKGGGDFLNQYVLCMRRLPCLLEIYPDCLYYAEIHSIKEKQSQDQLAVEVQLLRDGIPRNWHHLAVGKTGNQILRCGTANSAAEIDLSVHGFLHSKSRTRLGFENQRKFVNVFSNTKLKAKVESQEPTEYLTDEEFGDLMILMTKFNNKKT